MIHLCSIVMVGCLVLGGSTRSGYLSDVGVQLIAIPLLLVALWHLPGRKLGRGAWVVLAMGLAAVAVPVLQLIPLPPSIWTRLAGREPVVEAFGLIGRDLPWLPLSMTPRQTWLSALALLPPAALLLAILQLGYAERRRLSLVVLGVGLIGAAFGVVQVAQGPTGALNPFATGNSAEASGFFANRNHFAAQNYCLMLLVAAWAVEATAQPLWDSKRKKLEQAAILPIAACFIALVVLVAAQAMARSRAGLGLTIVALLGSLALAVSNRRNDGTGVTPGKLIVGAALLAVTFTVQLALYRILDRFTGDPLDDGRIRFAQRTIEAAKAYMPFGSGMGSFVQIYPLFERPQDTLIDTFANRAHNDLIEFWLEAGGAGLALMLVFVGWLALESVAQWRRPPPPGASTLDHALARAATLMLGLVLVHSIVDYPLRTEAMLAVMAFACALLVPPPVRNADETGPAEDASLAQSLAPGISRSATARSDLADQPPIPTMPDMPPPPPARTAVWPGQPAQAAVSQPGGSAASTAGHWPTAVPSAPAQAAEAWPAEWRRDAEPTRPPAPPKPPGWSDPSGA